MRPDAVAQPAIDGLTRHGGGVDKNYLYALDTLQRAEDLGFSISLIAQRFREYVPPEVVAKMERDPARYDAPRDAELTILFADVRGFTGIS